MTLNHMFFSNVKLCEFDITMFITMKLKNIGSRMGIHLLTEYQTINHESFQGATTHERCRINVGRVYILGLLCPISGSTTSYFTRNHQLSKRKTKICNKAYNPLYIPSGVSQLLHNTGKEFYHLVKLHPSSQ